MNSIPAGFCPLSWANFQSQQPVAIERTSVIPAARIQAGALAMTSRSSTRLIGYFGGDVVDAAVPANAGGSRQESVHRQGGRQNHQGQVQAGSDIFGGICRPALRQRNRSPQPASLSPRPAGCPRLRWSPRPVPGGHVIRSPRSRSRTAFQAGAEVTSRTARFSSISEKGDRLATGRLGRI